MRRNVYACLLAGGKGTRLWPLSTGDRSKSFVRIGERKPLIRETIECVRGLVGNKNIVIVVDKAQEALLKRLAGGIPKQNILIEPFGRSTASAVGLGAIELSPDDIMVVLPTDFLIKESARFKKAVKTAIDFVCKKENVLMCVGIKPKRPSTAYGYIKVKSPRGGQIYSVDKFMEKPKKGKAEKFIKNPNYLWNVGMFIFKAGDILEAIKTHAPLLYDELSCIKKNKNRKYQAYSRMKNISIDYQIMEKAKNLYCVKGDFSWCDLGSWVSLGELFKKDKKGNVCFGKANLIDTYDSIVYNSKKNAIGVVGLKGMIVAQTENGTLLSSKKDAEKVKELAGRLQRAKK